MIIRREPNPYPETEGFFRDGVITPLGHHNIMADVYEDKGYPEHAKLERLELVSDSEIISDFLDWLRERPDVELRLMSNQDVIDQYAGCDPFKLEKERDRGQGDGWFNPMLGKIEP